jgi:hypothetical protein
MLEGGRRQVPLPFLINVEFIREISATTFCKVLSYSKTIES